MFKVPIRVPLKAEDAHGRVNLAWWNLTMRRGGEDRLVAGGVWVVGKWGENVGLVR